MESPRYWAFISYSHRDSGWAEWLHQGLEKYPVPKPLIGTVTERGEVPKRLSPVFRDRDELPSATDLGTLLVSALSGSASQIVICSPQAAKSKWVNEEILAFKRLGRENRIFCLVVGGEPNATDMAGREDEECFPPALRFRLGSDGQLSDQRTEPIAADARPGKDGKNNAKLKLISGLLGVGFDSRPMPCCNGAWPSARRYVPRPRPEPPRKRRVSSSICSRSPTQARRAAIP
jgi:hypothetical protein